MQGWVIVQRTDTSSSLESNIRFYVFSHKSPHLCSILRLSIWNCQSSDLGGPATVPAARLSPERSAAISHLGNIYVWYHIRRFHQMTQVSRSTCKGSMVGRWRAAARKNLETLSPPPFPPSPLLPPQTWTKKLYFIKDSPRMQWTFIISWTVNTI